MTNLNEIILQMKDAEYVLFCESLKATQAEKYLKLTKHIRSKQSDDDLIMKDLSVALNSYYALRSRLHQRVKTFLSDQISASKTGLYLDVTHLPNLIYNTPKKSATAVLEKLEADLAKNDMPYELSHIYSALKKIHIHSPKYFHYSQLYNKTLAYTTALQKAEELLIDFNKNLAEYYVSRDTQLIDILSFVRAEMHNLSKLYSSHRLTLYKLFIDISFSLYFPESELLHNDKPIEDLLAEVNNILVTHPNDLNYMHLDRVYYFLAFEYYNNLGIHKKSANYFDPLKENFPTFLLYNFCAFPEKALITKIEYYTAIKKEYLLAEENETILQNYFPDPENMPGYITYYKYQAITSIISGKYVNAIDYLSSICGEGCSKIYWHTDIEMKLLLVLCYSMENGFEMAHQILKSITRKINEAPAGTYENAKAMAKLLHAQLSSPASASNIKKIQSLRDIFLKNNKGIYRMFEGINLDDDFISKLCKVVKNTSALKY